MKAQLDGVVLLDSSFRHVADPFGGKDPDGDDGKVSNDVEMLGTNDPNHFIVKLRVRVQSPDAAPNARYSIAVTFATLLNVSSEEGETRPEHFYEQLMILGASIAFPYVREHVSSMTGKGRFGAMWLNPQNFRNLFPTTDAQAEASPTTAKQ